MPRSSSTSGEPSLDPLSRSQSLHCMVDDKSGTKVLEILLKPHHHSRRAISVPVSTLEKDTCQPRYRSSDHEHEYLSFTYLRSTYYINTIYRQN